MRRLGTLALALLAPLPAAAQETSPPVAAGTELFYASDSDGTEVIRAALNFDIRNVSENDYIGASVEKAWYRPANGGDQSRERVFARAAGAGGDWQWRARVGTDGDNVVGAFSVNDTAAVRKELFVERDIVETRQGLQRGIYSTYVGMAVDLPADDRNTFTALVGVQEFTGDNVRLNLRGSYIHVVKRDWGVTAQLRGRYFRNSEPREFDYYSPRWFAEVLPVVQMRRFVRRWELVAAGGIGVQRDSDSQWRESRFAQARFRSPIRGSKWSANGAFVYTTIPAFAGTADTGYSYTQFSLGISRRF